VAAGVRRWLKYFSRFGPIEQALKRNWYPGLGIAPGITFNTEGSFTYGVGCSIGQGSNVLVPAQTALTLGEQCYVGRYVELGPGGKIVIGSHTSIQDRCTILGDVWIGRYCLISLNVLIGSGRHHFDLQPFWLILDQDQQAKSDPQASAERSRPVAIDDDCWLGINTVILPGVRIGKGSVVGAGSVVVRDVQPYTVVAGAPAREIRKRLDFVPPAHIRHSKPADWPYFYSGFELSRSAMQRHASRGGLLAHSVFTLCLDGAAANSIHLLARSANSSSCALYVGEQRRNITEQYSEVEFTSHGHFDSASCIQVRADPPTASVFVSEAWVA
jgi:acetyltransferase-like isoleucine patch superfamily enzyme